MHAHGHGPGHHHGHGRAKDRRALAVALGLIVVLTDAAALAAAFVASRLASRPARGPWTFGLGRTEILAAQANGLSLLATFVLSRADRSSLNVRGAYLHIATDLAAFAGTALAGGLVLLTGWNRFDPIAGLLVAALMARSSWSLLRESGRIFLEAAPPGVEPDEVARALAADDDVVEVHDLHVWTVTSGFPALAAHVLVAPGADCHDARRRLQALLEERFALHHTTLQVDHVARRSQNVRLGALERS